MKTKNGAHKLIETLSMHGVDTVFGYPGGSIMPAYDALFDAKDSIRHILVRHEQGAAHAAEGYAQTNGTLGVCITTSGPGATNLLTGIANAMMDSTPLLCITGQVTEALLGTQAFQEAPIVSMAKPVTKWCTQVTRANDIEEAIRYGIMTARSGRPGPVLIDITKNALTEECTTESRAHMSQKQSVPLAPDADALRQAADLLNNAERPYILTGHGVLLAHTQEELRHIVEKTGAPFASTLLGLGALPRTHPQHKGLLGMHGNYSANLATNRADVILAIGMRFDDRVTGKVSEYARQAKIIHIDIDAKEIGKLVQPTVAIQSDAKSALLALAPLLKQRTHDMWLSELYTLDLEEEKAVHTKMLEPESDALTMAETIRAIEIETKGDAIIVADVGQHQMITARYYRFTEKGRFITSGGLGTMGFSLPTAIGATVAQPQKTVVAIMGDGSAQMNIQELGTIMQEHIPVKMVILNNGYLGMVRQWQELFFEKRYSSVSLESPDFVALAAAYGIPGACITKRAELAQGVSVCINAESAYLLEVRVDTEENVFPIIPGGAGIADIRLQ